jgi:hypothetical protein
MMGLFIFLLVFFGVGRGRRVSWRDNRSDVIPSLITLASRYPIILHGRCNLRDELPATLIIIIIIIIIRYYYCRSRNFEFCFLFN